jgi:hypothetical protein
MPTLLRRGPYRFFIYSNENNEPPHIHIQRERALAKFWLKPVRLANANGFSGVEIRNLQRLVTKNNTQLLEAWNDYFKH